MRMSQVSCVYQSFALLATSLPLAAPSHGMSPRLHFLRKREKRIWIGWFWTSRIDMDSHLLLKFWKFSDHKMVCALEVEKVGFFYFIFLIIKKGGLIKIIIKRFCFLTMIGWYHEFFFSHWISSMSFGPLDAING